MVGSGPFGFGLTTDSGFGATGGATSGAAGAAGVGLVARDAIRSRLSRIAYPLSDGTPVTSAHGFT